MEKLKVVVIGGGSSYTPELVEGIILKIQSLPVGEVVLVDVELGKEKVKINYELVERMFEKAGLDTKLSYTFDRKSALTNADFVMTQFRVGGLAARAKDEQIPLKYNMIGQETTGMGGFFKALRTIPVMMDISKDMEEVCPNAWLINFTNPSGIVTEALQTRTNVKTIGLCNVPINMHHDAAEKLEVEPSEIKTNFIGLNHLSFMNHCYYKGEDVIAKVLSVESEEGLVKNIEKIEEADVFASKLGLMPSPYMQYFFFEQEMMAEERECIESGEGSRAEQVMKVEEDLFKLYTNKDLKEKPEELSMRGGSRYSEAAISLIDSIHNNRGDIQVVNTMNRGSITDLPYESAVEVNCVINDLGATPVANGSLPKSVSQLIQQVKRYEEYTIEAALTGDVDAAMLALLNNPLVKSLSDGKKAFDELVLAHKEYLPQFKQYIDELSK